MRIAAMVSLALVAGCGSGPAVCGNGIVEVGEDCDKGSQNGVVGVNCSANCKSVSTKQTQMSISWAIDLVGKGDPIPGYTTPGCSNFGATKAHVIIDGPSPSDKVVDCSRYVLKYPTCLTLDTDMGEQCDMHPDPGPYQATVTLLRDDMTAITNAVSTPMINVVPGPEVPFPITFQMTDFLKQDYTGTLDFLAGWGAPKTNCMSANPMVTKEGIILRDAATDMIVMGMTTKGTKLDGTPGSCFSSDMINMLYEEVDNLPWGRYNLSIFDPNGPFCAKVPVFVNPGMFNTTFNVTVPMYTPPSMDAGVPGDGGVDDGGMSMVDGGAPSCP
jgi:hypothetical protein